MHNRLICRQSHDWLRQRECHVSERGKEVCVYEVLLTHNRWTLIDRSAGELITQAHAAGMGIVNAAIYGGGIIAKPRGGSTMHGYRRASPQTLEAVAHMADVCDRWNTDLATAALQASLRDARISSTVIGISKVARLENVMAAQSAELADDFWSEIGELLPSPENWLDRKSLS